jgi:acetylornithine deacetylase/succinyl-diaminopimelate desuccinylase-like protein
MQRALDHAKSQAAAFERALFEFVRIPSISAQPDHAKDVARSAEWLRARMETAGLAARVVSSPGQHPLVVGRSKPLAGKPTVLVYGHHDVQPVDPLSEWEHPPFEATVVDGVLRCRGGADDKGPTLAMVCAAEAWNRGGGGLPVNVVFAVEGEEESGGHHLADFIRAHPDELRADCLVILDVAGFAAGVPALCYGLRGIQTMEIRVDGPAHDLHSGGFGGLVENPAEVVARLVASCRNPDGSISIPGVLDDVDPIDPAERARMAALPDDEASVRAEAGVPAFFGEPGYTSYERNWARPTFEVNGIFGGYQGAGSKTIIPSWAGAKLSLRLVPRQDPAKVFAAVKRHFEQRCPRTVTLTVAPGHGAAAILTPPAGPWAEKARRSMEAAYGVAPKLVRAGGSIPIAQVFHEVLGLPPLLFGTYSPGERAHAPNERYPIADFHSAIRAGIRFFGAA